MTARPTTWRADSTACATLVVIPGQPDASPLAEVRLGRFTLLHSPSGRRIAAADEPAALHHLAQQLAWFDSNATDPRYLEDPANADLCESLRELLRQWCATETDYDPHATFLAGADNPRCQPRSR